MPVKQYVKKLLLWYNENGRLLPWRGVPDPYLIWVSEIILQQTRVQQGFGYYERFIQTFPTVFSLALSPLEAVLKAWEGLGYYARARNMHRCAVIIVNKFQGIFPKDLKELLELPGVGPYTARAIASFAFNQRVAVLDGNVFRILSRFYADETPINASAAKKHFQELADSWACDTPPADFNAAMMDLGSLVCTPQKPKCITCPLAECCRAYIQKVPTSYPRLLPAKIRAKRFLVFQLMTSLTKNELWLRKRPENGLWGGLWELPNYETTEQEWSNIAIHQGVVKPFKHILTHITYWITAVYSNSTFFDEGIWANTQKLAELPLSKPTHKILRSLPDF